MRFVGSSLLRTDIRPLLEVLFDRDIFLERIQFPPLHRIVLGLADYDLRHTLDLPASTTNDNAHGRTAFSWAAARGDVDTLITLPSRGPNVSLKDNHDTCALLFACSATNPSCIRPLLQAGADPDSRDRWGDAGLHHSLPYFDDTEYILPLLGDGLHPDVRGNIGRPALIYAKAATAWLPRA